MKGFKLRPFTRQFSNIGGGFSKSTTPAAQMGDILSSSRIANGKAKLMKGLERKDSFLSPASQGMLDATGVDVADILNEALETDKLQHIFQGTDAAAYVVEIVTATMNQDCSHVTAFWKSELLDKFVKFVSQNHGQQESMKIQQQTQRHITKRLQDREPTFRSLLMQKMSFKRVPRIYFKAQSDDTSEKDFRQQLLREYAQNNDAITN